MSDRRQPVDLFWIFLAIVVLSYAGKDALKDHDRSNERQACIAAHGTPSGGDKVTYVLPPP